MYVGNPTFSLLLLTYVTKNLIFDVLLIYEDALYLSKANISDIVDFIFKTFLNTMF